MSERPDMLLSPDVLLRAYAAGVFPMADSADDPDIFWVDPHIRGVIPLNAFHVPRRLRRTVRSRPFDIRIDTDFAGVIDACAAPVRERGRDNTWINRPIREAYARLHEAGFAHSVECWREGRLVGGLYGVRLGAAFFGESMFSFARDASKVALVHLVARLRAGGFVLLDTQFITNHLRQFGAIEVPRAEYHVMLEAAIGRRADFGLFDADDDPERVLEIAQGG